MDARSPHLPSDSPPKGVESLTDGSGWKAARGEPSLAGLFASVKTAKQGPFWRKLLAFLGPGYLVAVG
jgi:manganese transport protein